MSNLQVNYGVQLLNISREFKKCSAIEKPLDFSIILNRMYLDNYKTYDAVWKDISRLYEQVEIYFESQNTDMTKLSRRLKRLSVYLYQIWHRYAIGVFEKVQRVNIHGISLFLNL